VEEEPEPKRPAKGLEEAGGVLGFFTGAAVTGGVLGFFTGAAVTGGGRAGGALFLTSGAGAKKAPKGDPAGFFFSGIFATETGAAGAVPIDFLTAGTLIGDFRAAGLTVVAVLAAVAGAPAAGGGTLFFTSFSGVKRPPNEKPADSFFFSSTLAATGTAAMGVLDAGGPAVGNFKAGLAAAAVELVTAGAAGFLASSFSGAKRPPKEKPPVACFFFSGALVADAGATATDALAGGGPAVGNLRAGVTAGLEEAEEERGDEDGIGFAGLLLLLEPMGLPPIFNDTAGLDGAATDTDFTTEEEEMVPVEEDLGAEEEGASPVTVAISLEGARVMLSTVSETATWIPSTVFVTELLIAVAVRPGIAAISSAVACALRLAA
jgi:hypothetical protein